MRSYRRSIAKPTGSTRRRSLSLPSHRFAMRIDLMGVRPPIWHRIETNSDLTLDTFHMVIQVSFEWTDSHLHEFRQVEPGGRPTGDPILMPYMIEEGDEGIPEATVRLGDVLSKPKDKLNYMYDFGDSWEHRILLEDVKEPECGLTLVTCTGGKRAAPPDDCGGVWGYQTMLDAGRDPKHPDHEEASERIAWAFGEGADFAPESFDLDRTNKTLAKMAMSGFKW